MCSERGAPFLLPYVTHTPYLPVALSTAQPFLRNGQKALNSTRGEQEHKQVRREVYLCMCVYGYFQNNVTRPMRGFEARASREVPAMLEMHPKCSKKGV